MQENSDNDIYIEIPNFYNENNKVILKSSITNDDVKNLVLNDVVRNFDKLFSKNLGIYEYKDDLVDCLVNLIFMDIIGIRSLSEYTLKDINNMDALPLNKEKLINLIKKRYMGISKTFFIWRED